MKCPRCQSPIGPLSDPEGVTTCPGCGSRLMTRSAALRSHGSAKPAASASSPPPIVVSVPADASRTVPPGVTGLGTKPTAASAPPVGSDTTRKRKAEAKGKAEIEAALDLVLQEVRAVRATQDRILRAIAEHFNGLGARPFIVPAMGSHGGATPAGQRQVFAIG